jgi:hypothetical protein
VVALEAGGYKVIRDNWYKHISVPLQTGRCCAQDRPGCGGLKGPSGGIPLQPISTHRSEKVPVVQGDIRARPAPCHKEQGVF